MNNNAPEEPDKSQLEPELIIERVEKIYNEWLQHRKGAQRKLEPDDKSANQPDP